MNFAPLSRLAVFGLISLVCGAATARAQAPGTESVVDIRMADGAVLKGTLFASATPGPAVLLLHQCDEQRKVWGPLGARLAAAGVTALAIDYRGYGESSGTPHDSMPPAALAEMMERLWPRDIDAAFAWLSSHRGVDSMRMAAAGGSCGVNNAIHLAMRHANVRALALLAGTSDRAAREFLEHSSGVPVFTAAAADDRYANFVEIMPWFAALSHNSKSRVAQYEHGGHAAMIFGAHPGLADTMATWFSAVLGSRSATLPRTNGTPMSASVLRTLHQIDAPGGAAQLMKKLASARKSSSNVQLFPEYFANLLGYEHLASNDTAGALAIMQLNAEAYPRSPNAMDSLGDIYLARGDTAATLRFARNTIKLLERDTADSDARKNDIRNAANAKLAIRKP